MHRKFVVDDLLGDVAALAAGADWAPTVAGRGNRAGADRDSELQARIDLLIPPAKYGDGSVLG